MNLVQLSDLHFGTEDPTAIEAAGRFIADMEPDALIVCGDVTQRGKRREFEAARRWIAGFDRPALVVPGNHDTPLLNLVARVSDPFGRFTDYFSDMAGPLELGSWRFAGLNTARGWQARRNWAEGSVDLEALEEIAAHAPRTAIVCHHPFVSPPETPLRTRTRRGRRADAALKRAPASLLLSGHVHAPTAVRRSGPEGAYIAITAGTLSTRLRRAPPGCNLLRLEDECVHVTGLQIVGGAGEARPLGVFPTGGKEA